MQRKRNLQKTAERCVEILKERYRVKKVILIGSLVNGIIHERSDIDLVVEGLPNEIYPRSCIKNMPKWHKRQESYSFREI